MYLKFLNFMGAYLNVCFDDLDEVLILFPLFCITAVTPLYMQLSVLFNGGCVYKGVKM